MSSLYRCRARVAYRPYGSDRLIVFEERQIQELSVKLKWKPNLAISNAEQATPASVYSNILSDSQCSVTIADPYLTGLAWPALFDAAALYTASINAQANNIMLPACKKGQDPNVDNCFNYLDLDPGTVVESGADTSGFAKFAHLILSLWYDVKGTSFGTDYYFRISNISIGHGSKYPSVTLRGQEAKTVLFNQSLVNMSFDEGMSVEESIKKIAEKYGYETSFCANSNGASETQRLNTLNRTVRLRGATPDEIITKLINSTGGNSLTQPIKEYANKISICTRGEVNQGCTVFYLGKGLYENYEISAEPEVSLLPLNMESGGTFNNADPYVSESFSANAYLIDDIVPNKRKVALEKVKKVQFPELFASCAPKCSQWPSSSGTVWKGTGPSVINERVKDTILYGVAPNGTSAISYLNGVVEEASSESGRVVIKTDFGLRMCETNKSGKCFARPIFQQSTNLSEVKVTARDKVEVSQGIGTSTAEKKEFVKLYIMGHNNEMITLDPQLVWKYAIPTDEILKLQQPAVSSGGEVVPDAPKSSVKDWRATTTEKPTKVLLMAGHEDLTSSGAPNEPALNMELVKWAQRNAATYGISDYVEFYFPPSSNLDINNPNSQVSITKSAVKSGKQVIEVHNDEAAGKSGIIPPRNGNKIWQLDDSLSNAYGSFSVNHRDGLAIPNRGGAILEVGRMDSATRNVFLNGTPAQKDTLYKQLMEPAMKAIAAERSRTGSVTTPATATSGTSSGQKICFKMGDSGNSTGPHLHAQWGDGFNNTARPITVEQVRKYVDVPGTFTSGYGRRTAPGGIGSINHKGVDIANVVGTPVCLKDGVSVKQIVETKCATTNSPGCGDGYGNSVIISTPEGDMFLGHLAQNGIPPGVVGMTSTSGGGNNKPIIQSTAGTNGVRVETGFKGVPRALRIIPGRTILSFITEYEEWIEGGRRPDAPDPGVWIPKRFKNWFVTECEYKWRDGDLRVNIEGVSQWGLGVTQVPLFSKYMEKLKSVGEATKTSYYDYIRSLGSLSWKTDDGKDSTEVICREAQEFAALQAGGTESSGVTPSPTNVTGSFPTANCRIEDPVKDEIIRGLYASGINTANGLAGVLGNIQEESRFDPNIHNTSEQGFTCLSTGGTREKCYGLVQWGGSRKASVLGKCGQTSTLNCQLQFLAQELSSPQYRRIVQKLNNSKSPGEAAVVWARDFEVSDPAYDGRRITNANNFIKQLKCDKPS